MDDGIIVSQLNKIKGYGEVWANLTLYGYGGMWIVDPVTRFVVDQKSYRISESHPYV